MPQFDRLTILMCPPDYYGIEYEINPWMSRSRQSDRLLAESQWRQLRDVLISVGADIRMLEAVKGLPDLVFTENAALMWRDRAYLARFRHAARQPETAVDGAWFQAAGFETHELPLATIDSSSLFTCLERRITPSDFRGINHLGFSDNLLTRQHPTNPHTRGTQLQCDLFVVGLLCDERATQYPAILQSHLHVRRR